MLGFVFLWAFLSSARCAEILYDGRAQPDFDASVLNNSTGPYLTYVVPASRAAPTNSLDAQRRQGI